MLGTKLLLLSFVVYVSGQGVSYHGSSNVRTQSRLLPRAMYRPPQRNQAAPGPQPGVYQPPQERTPPQITYFPDSYPPMRGPEPESITPALEIPPQPIYSPIPPQPTIPVQSAPRPLNPRPLQPLAWKTEQAPVVLAENITPIHAEAQMIYPESSTETSIDILKADELDSEIEATPKPAPVEEPAVVVQPEAEKEFPTLPAESSSDIEINPQPARVPEPEPEQEMTPPPFQELTLIPEEPPIVPIPNQEQPTLYPEQLTPYPEPLIPVPRPQPVPEPQPISPENNPNPQPLPPAPRPLPTVEPVTLPEPIIPEPAITSQPESIPVQPDYQPIKLPKPVGVYQPPQPMPPPRPNYRPIPDEPVIPSTSRPLSTLIPSEPRPNYQPLPPRPIPANPYPSPLPTLILPTPYPTAVPSQPLPEPTTLLPTVITTSNVPLVEPEIISVIPVYDFECKGSGYYTVVNECDSYIECQSRGTFKHTCPDGLHFNSQALYPEYPCAYPSEVKCESTASKQVARPTNQCPNRYGFFPISEGDCSKYLMCQEGMATIMSCPFGLVFNEQLSSCDWPENVPQCNSNAFKDFTCPRPPADDPDMLTRFRYGSECGMYVACQRGHPRLLRCDLGLSFDENSQVCVDSDFVPACRIPIPT